MTVSIATISLGHNTLLPLRIFINRKQLANQAHSNTVFETPLLSNNSLISLKSPTTRIYLSDNDMADLCHELKDDLLLIIYELTSPMITDTILHKLKNGSTFDFQDKVINQILNLKANTDQGDDVNNNPNFLESNITTITRLSKFKYKLNFKLNWEVDIYINNILKITRIRHFLLFGNTGNVPLDIYDKKKVLLMHRSSVILPEEENEEIPLIIPDGEGEDKKPEIAVDYKKTISFRSCIDIHILQRPRRHR